MRSATGGPTEGRPPRGRTAALGSPYVRFDGPSVNFPWWTSGGAILERFQLPSFT
jgi:hypothetical protein